MGSGKRYRRSCHLLKCSRGSKQPANKLPLREPNVIVGQHAGLMSCRVAARLDWAFPLNLRALRRERWDGDAMLPYRIPLTWDRGASTSPGSSGTDGRPVIVAVWLFWPFHMSSVRPRSGILLIASLMSHHGQRPAIESPRTLASEGWTGTGRRRVFCPNEGSE